MDFEKEIQIIWSHIKSERKELNVMWFPELDLREGILTKENGWNLYKLWSLVNSYISMLVILVLRNVLRKFKMGENGWGVSRNSLYYIYKFSTNLKLFQTKTFIFKKVENPSFILLIVRSY